jgi:hypothetical protein
MADNPELTGVRVDEADIDPATWRNVSLQMTKEDGGLLDIVLLRPLEWIDAYGAQIDGTIHLDLEEFGAVGPAQVLSIDPCPPIEDGPGRVVTATFAHSSADILDIHVEGLSDPIGTTANHPFWSESRQSFVAAGSLGVGEQLLLADGSCAHVASIVPRTDAQPVYNIEVDGEHAYYVSDAGVLVHNACAWDRWNVGQHALQSNHNWSKILGRTTPTLSNIRPYLDDVLRNGTWQKIGDARGPGGTVIGEILEATHKVDGFDVYVRAFKDLAGRIIVNNGGVL